MHAAMSRSELTTQLQQTLRAVISRRMGVSLALVGEAGIGKTHLSQQILQGVSCKCLSVHANIPADGVVNILPRTRPWPHWAERQLSRAAAGERLEAPVFLSALVASLGQMVPLLIHVEDWHDAPPERQKALVQLAQMVGRTRGIGLMVTSRRPLPEPFRNVSLPPLDEQDLRELVQRELTDAPPGEAVQWLSERTGGNPLFTLEFLRYLRATGALWHDAQAWHWREPQADALPVTVDAMIEQQLRQQTLTELQWQVLRARAVFPPGLAEEPLYACWPAVASLDEMTLRNVQQQLNDQGLLRGSAFSHPLFAEVIRAGLGVQQRQLSSLAFDALKEHWPELAFPLLGPAGANQAQARPLLNRLLAQARAHAESVQVAHWLAESVKWTTGLEKYQLAYQAAVALSDVGRRQDALPLAELAAEQLPEAARLHVHFLALSGQVEAARQGLDLLPAYLRDTTWFETSIWMFNARGLYRELIELWVAHPEWHQRVDLDTCRLVGNAYAYTDDLEQAEGLARNLLAREHLTPLQRYQVIHVLGQVYQRARDWERLLPLVPQAMVLTHDLPNPLHYAMVLVNHSSTLTTLQRFEKSQALLYEAREIYTRVGHPVLYAVTGLRLGEHLLRQANFLAAEGLMREAHTILERHEQWRWLTESHLKLAKLYLTWRPLHGLPLGNKHALAALELARKLSYVQFIHSSLRQCTWAAALEGRSGEALRYAQEMQDLVATSPNCTERGEAQVMLGLAHESAGDRIKAEQCLRAALQTFQDAGAANLEQQWGLELDRIRGDRESTQERIHWLKANGHAGEAWHTEQRLLAAEPVNPEPSNSAPIPHFRVLGRPQLELESKVIPCRARKRLELLICLLEARLAGHPEVPVLDLVDQLYPEHLETQGKQAVKQIVYLTRAMLGNLAIQSTPSGYQLGQFTSDAEEFLLNQDSALWQGPYLAGFLGSRTSTVQDALASALQSCVEAVQGRDVGEAARLAGILSDMEPYDEQMLRQVVSLLVTSSQKHAALLRFSEARTRFRDLGVELPGTLDDFLSGHGQASRATL